MNIDEMPAGREMDSLIAEKVLDCWVPNSELIINKRDRQTYEMPHYSTDIAAAWEVVEKIGGGHTVIRYRDGSYRCIHERTMDAASAETAPLAICRAALKLVMGAGQG